jgi:molybdopterin molybdotransferase
MQGLGAAPLSRLTARLSHDLPIGGPREHYMRAVVQNGVITPEQRQDSALLSVLANANALMVRLAEDPARHAGDEVSYIPL